MCECEWKPRSELGLGFYAYISLYLYLYNYLVRPYIGPEPVSPTDQPFSPIPLNTVGFGLWELCSWKETAVRPASEPFKYEVRGVSTPPSSAARYHHVEEMIGNMPSERIVVTLCRSTLQLLTGLPIAMRMLSACVINDIILLVMMLHHLNASGILYFSL